MLDLISWMKTGVAIHITPNTLHLRPRSWMTARGWQAGEAVFYALSSDNKIIPKRSAVCLHHRAEVWQMEHNIKHCRASRGYQRLPAAAFSTAAPRLKKKRKKNVRGTVSGRMSLRGNRALVLFSSRWVCHVLRHKSPDCIFFFTLWDAFSQRFAGLVFESRWLGTSATFPTFTGWFDAHF